MVSVSRSPDNDVRIVDLDDPNKEMPLGAGRVAVQGPDRDAGVLENPEETEKTFVEGWLATGDIAYLDSDGHIFIVDRKKDMILSSGFNVVPARDRRADVRPSKGVAGLFIRHSR